MSCKLFRYSDTTRTIHICNRYRPSSKVINKIDEIIFLFNEMIVVGNEYIKRKHDRDMDALNTIVINANMWNEMWQWKYYDVVKWKCYSILSTDIPMSNYYYYYCISKLLPHSGVFFIIPNPVAMLFKSETHFSLFFRENFVHPNSLEPTIYCILLRQKKI